MRQLCISARTLQLNESVSSDLQSKADDIWHNSGEFNASGGDMAEWTELRYVMVSYK